MMKDRQLVHKVISIQRMERTKRTFRIYQVLKLIRREMIVEFRKKIPDKKISTDLQKHVVEAFMLCDHKGPKGVLRNEQIFSLIRLCGGSTCLTKQECFILMKKIHVNQKVAVVPRGPGQQSMDNAVSDSQAHKLDTALGHIQLSNFIKAVEMVMNDTKLDPFILVSKLFTTYYSGMEKVSFEDFKKFFVRFNSYFAESDTKLFLEEVRLLMRKDELIDISEVASMIRNDIELMPK